MEEQLDRCEHQDLWTGGQRPGLSVSVAAAPLTMVWDSVKKTQACLVCSGSMENTTLQDRTFGHLCCNNPSFVVKNVDLTNWHLGSPQGWTILFPGDNLYELQRREWRSGEVCMSAF